MSPFYLGKVGAMNVLKTEFVINDNGPGVTAADEGVVVYVPTNEKKCPRHLMVAVPTVRVGEGGEILVEARGGGREGEEIQCRGVHVLPTLHAHLHTYPYPYPYHAHWQVDPETGEASPVHPSGTMMEHFKMKHHANLVSTVT